MTPPAHIWVNKGTGTSTAWQLHKIYQQQASSNTKHQHCVATMVTKLQLYKDTSTSYYPGTRHALVDLFWSHMHTQHCVSKYHSAGLANSQVQTPQTEPDTQQTGIKQEAPVLYNHPSRCCHIRELWSCWYIQKNIVFTTSKAPSSKCHPLPHTTISQAAVCSAGSSFCSFAWWK